MKMSDVELSDVAEYLREDEADVQETVLQMAMAAAKDYIIAHTGRTEEELDKWDDVTVAYLILCQDIYDHRTLYPDAKYANSMNRTVDAILGHHAVNFV